MQDSLGLQRAFISVRHRRLGPDDEVDHQAGDIEHGNEEDGDHLGGRIGGAVLCVAVDPDDCAQPEDECVGEENDAPSLRVDSRLPPGNPTRNEIMPPSVTGV